MAIWSNIWNIEVDPDLRFDPDVWSVSTLKIRINLNISKLYLGNLFSVSISFKFYPLIFFMVKHFIIAIYKFDPEPDPHFRILCEHGARGATLCGLVFPCHSMRVVSVSDCLACKFIFGKSGLARWKLMFIHFEEVGFVILYL